MPKALICNHTDIWFGQCMEMMVAFWRVAESEAAVAAQDAGR
jgi:hypothetical protein